MCYTIIYCILRGRIKGFNSAIYAIKCQQVVIGASLSKPHTSGKLGTVVMYTNYEKKRTVSIFGWYGRFMYTNNSDEKRTNSIFGWYDCSCRKR